MDDKGYAFTPLAFLLMIPVVIIAASYGNITSELNMISQIAIGGDITYTTASTVVTTVQKSIQDAGRNASFLATKQVINNEAARMNNPFFNNSTAYVQTLIAAELNNATIETCKQLKTETGRNISINGVDITDDTPDNATVFTASNIVIYQTEPYGFYVNLTGNIPLTVSQNGQKFTANINATPTYVSIQGLEDPYIWVNTKDRRFSVIYKYPYYDSNFNLYHFDDNSTGGKLQHLWDCLNGTNNNASIALNPYYFPDPNGLTFFDRLENRTSSANSNTATRMSTFVIGDPLEYDTNGQQISAVDRQYFNKVSGIPIKVGSLNMTDPYPKVTYFYLSNGNPNYFTLFNLKTSY